MSPPELSIAPRPPTASRSESGLNAAPTENDPVGPKSLFSFRSAVGRSQSLVVALEPPVTIQRPSGLNDPPPTCCLSERFLSTVSDPHSAKRGRSRSDEQGTSRNASASRAATNNCFRSGLQRAVGDLPSWT